ncbi:MAG: hypothetical protein HYS32_01085 [Candidatus Woesearchaeota archaeon]|nr:MAG: hypothetical protein HYS32_01085 [Candidatus Woesearchaeota archaeon]
MNKEEILQTIKLVRSYSKKRNFNQGFDLIINLKDLDLKKDKVEAFVTFDEPFRGIGVGAFVDSTLKSQAEELCDVVIVKDNFNKFKDNKKEIKKMSKNVDFFISQADLMAQVATVFGKVLGPRGLMPNPKVGAVILPKGNIKPIVDKLKKTTKVEAKGGMMIKILVGKEDMGDEKISNNVIRVYESLVNALPKGEQNVKNSILKFTMGIPIAIGEKEEHVKERVKAREEILAKDKPKKEKANE